MSTAAEYIRQELSRGVSTESIRDALLKQGWKVEDVDLAFREAQGTPQASPATTSVAPQQSQEQQRPSNTVPAFLKWLLILATVLLISTVAAMGAYSFFFIRVIPITDLPPLTATSTPQTEAGLRDAARVRDIGALQKALERYRVKVGEYPQSLSVLAPAYLPSVPNDPDGTAYPYDQRGGGVSYELGANLEEIGTSALAADAADAISPGGALTSGHDANSCTGTPGRFCYNVAPN